MSADTATIDTSNREFTQAVAFVNNTNEPLFVTGKAGTGKTTFLRYIKQHTRKRCAIVAPTGVAAMNAGGETIHSFLQLPLGPFAPGSAVHLQGDEQIQDRHTLLTNLRMNDLKRKLIRRLDMLIVDEVSMVRADVLDAMDLVLRHVRRNYLMPFGGLQMIFIGDPFQLPPVVREEDWTILKHFYRGAYFFDAHIIHQYPPVYIELKKIYRQKDEVFIGLLNRVRNGTANEEDVALLNECYEPGTDRKDGYIVLCTHNHIADDINKRGLREIDEPLYTFEATITGEINERNISGERLLQLKKGAQVMFIRNDLQVPRRYYNGKTGHVSSVNETSIRVAFDNEPDEVVVPLETWRAVRYRLNATTGNVEEEETGSFTQYPLRLAWAVTIHKSQGLTLDKAVIDLNRAFAPGQVYVALSRCTSLQGIVLRSPLRMQNIMVDDRVVEFCQYEQEGDELEATLAGGVIKARAQVLQQQFSLDALQETLHEKLDQIMKARNGPKTESLELYEQIMNALTTANEHVGGFGRQLQTLITGGNEEKLKERHAAAVSYFATTVMGSCLMLAEPHLQILKDHPKAIKLTRIWTDITDALTKRKQELEALEVV
jgi:hypothetical protein